MQNEDNIEDADGATVDGKDASQRNSGKSHKSSSKRRLVPPVIRHEKNWDDMFEIWFWNIDNSLQTHLLTDVY